MASLYRCRGSAEEIRSLFGCEAKPGLTWRSLVRPRQQGLVVRRHGRTRIAEVMHWGMPAPAASRRKFLWTERDPFAELAFGDRNERPRRCLIVLDSFALPAGPSGRRTRCWFGLWDEPLFAWAGLWREIEGSASFLGAVTDSNAIVKRAGPIMPVILKPGDVECWLFGTVREVLPLWRKPFAPEAMWLEESDELWTSGLCLGELEAHRVLGSSATEKGRQ